MLNLDQYKLPLLDAPSDILHAVHQGVQSTSFPSSNDAQTVLGGLTPPANGVFRDREGRVFVACVTDMPKVTPAMIDWWFAWHMPESARYQLWHPKAHIRSSAKESRSSSLPTRGQYIGNISYVDEYIGSALKKLAIAFVSPATFNIHDLDVRHATAICAHTSDRILNSQGGCLIHYVVLTAEGSQMRSGFWLGDLKHHNGFIDRTIGGFLNTPLLRRHLVSDQMALDLLQHCGEEMNHLARFLPMLFSDMHQ